LGVADPRDDFIFKMLSYGQIGLLGLSFTSATAIIEFFCFNLNDSA